MVNYATQHSYIPSDGHRLKHDPFSAIVGPRPIGWISSCGRDGSVNLAPYSFFCAFNYAPPIIGFSSIGYKDTLRNVEQTGEFVWNLTTRELADAMNQTSMSAAPEDNEFDLAGLQQRPSLLVKPPRVARSPVNFECKVSDIVQLKSHQGSLLQTWMVFGEVIMVHIEQYLIVDGVYKAQLGEPVLRGGGASEYFSMAESQIFHIHRPK